MEQQELYPELVDYIYNYEYRFMTEDERYATGNFIFNLVSDDPRERLREGGRLKQAWANSDARKQMLKEGSIAFKDLVVKRIYANHKHELNLNLCPKCGKIARTPLAKQCRFCFYDWH